ncbi:MAG: YraN family protein, partial [Kofleriaceae bacterium]|nr:YraN family protein [Kofleriaceae bacterium]
MEDPRRERGAAAESLACKLLGHHGYRILERNFRCKLGELDIVADDRGTLVFVEVRSRSDGRFGRATVGHTKQQQVSRVASWYLVQHRP